MSNLVVNCIQINTFVLLATTERLYNSYLQRFTERYDKKKVVDNQKNPTTQGRIF